jgi:molybdopterin converting factor small subunit
VIVRLRLFATAREAAGCATDTIELPEGATLAAALDAAVARYGTGFADVLAASGVWVNGDEPESGRGSTLHADDEIAVLPPVSGGAGPNSRLPGRCPIRD